MVGQDVVLRCAKKDGNRDKMFENGREGRRETDRTAHRRAREAKESGEERRMGVSEDYEEAIE